MGERTIPTPPGSDPDYRFTLANERTFLAWVRTALGLLAGGVAVLAVLSDFGPDPLRRTAGMLLLALAVVVVIVAYRRWRATELALRTGRSLPGPMLMRLVTGGVVLLVVLVTVLALLS